MNRNTLYLVIGALAVVTAVLSYRFYQERQKTTGVEISVGERGISIEKNSFAFAGEAVDKCQQKYGG
jgi:hypothetical protein